MRGGRFFDFWHMNLFGARHVHRRKGKESRRELSFSLKSRESRGDGRTISSVRLRFVGVAAALMVDENFCFFCCCVGDRFGRIWFWSRRSRLCAPPHRRGVGGSHGSARLFVIIRSILCVERDGENIIVLRSIEILL